MLTILVTLLFFILGIITFPILFFFQKIFRLPSPNLAKATFHIHHSFYGLLLILIGVILLIVLHKISGFYIGAFGVGFIVHHELSEPELKGVEKFIYFKKKKY